MLKLLTTRPMRVNLFASGSKKPFSSLSSVIVLNFKILKIFPLRPGLSWVKNTPAPLLAKCKHIDTKRRGIARTTNAENENTKSKMRLKNK